MAEPKYEVITAEDFTEYMEIVSQFGDSVRQDLCLFRGQPCDKPLIPNLGRVECDNFREYEKSMYEDFKKRYLAYSPKRYDNDFDLLALAQHFGLPTRLLDWTENALTALWFATETEVCEEHSVVWIFYPEQADILDNKEVSPFTVRSTKVFCPNHISERITAQAGWFTCHALQVNNRFVRFENLAKYSGKLVKILIPKKAFPEIRVKLNMVGTNSATVYPDLNGLSRHLKWKHLKAERF